MSIIVEASVSMNYYYSEYRGRGWVFDNYVDTHVVLVTQCAQGDNVN